MKKTAFYFVILLLSFLIFTVNSVQAATTKPTAKSKKTYTEREYTVNTKDGHLIHAYLSYPKTKQKGYPTIIMLHSLGRSAYYWKPLQEKFNNLGFAVLRMDFRGHGKSVYNKTFHQKSWTTFKNNTFAKYPQDVLDTIETIQKSTKKPNFTNYAIIGSDIGANTAILVAKEMTVKPKALVLIAPSMSFKSLYVPVALTEIGNTPILAISSKTDNYFMKEQEKIAKFAQGVFDVYNLDSGLTDMLIIRQNPEVQPTIINWVVQYFKK